MLKPGLQQLSALPQFQLPTRLTVRRHGAFQEASPHHTHRPVVPLLFTTDMNAIAEKGKEKCLVQVLCEFVTNNYLEPKYVPVALLNEIASPQKSLPDVLSLQEEFWRQLQQNNAVAEETSEESAMEVTVAGTEKDETHDDTDESDSEFGDVKTSLKGKPWGSQQEHVCRAKVLFSKLKTTDFASEEERNWDNGISALDVLQDVLRADYNAYQNLRHFIIGYRETKDRNGTVLGPSPWRLIASEEWIYSTTHPAVPAQRVPEEDFACGSKPLAAAREKRSLTIPPSSPSSRSLRQSTRRR